MYTLVLASLSWNKRTGLTYGCDGHRDAAKVGFHDHLLYMAIFRAKKNQFEMFARCILITKPHLPPSTFQTSCIRDTGFFGKDFLLSNGLENEDFLSPCLVLFLKGLLRNFSCLSEGLFGPFFDELFGPIGSFLPIRAKHPSFMTYKRRRVPEVRQ